MHKIKKMWLKDESGVSLMIVLMALVILTLLGTALATISFANVKLTTNDREYQSTYYIAEAGVNQAYAQIENELIEIYETRNSQESFFTGVNDYLSIEIDNVAFENFEESFSEMPKAIISIDQLTNENPSEYKITSEGVIGNRSRTVEKIIEVKWVSRGTGPILPLNVALISKESVKLTGSAKVNGHVHLLDGGVDKITLDGNGNIHQPDQTSKGLVHVHPDSVDHVLNVPDWYNDSPEIKGSDSLFQLDSLIELLDIAPATTSKTMGDISISGNTNQEISLSSNTYIENIRIEGNNNLNIDIGDDEYHLVVNNFELEQGHVNIIGSGTLHLHVLDTFSIGGSSSINKNGTINQLNYYYYGGNPFILGGSQRIKGSLYIEKASVNIGGSGEIEGGYVLTGSSDLTIDGGSHNNLVILAPKAFVTLGGGAQVNGVVIAKRYEASGGNSINYRDVNTDDFPFGSGEAVDNIDLIEAQPTQETDE
ncbi:pilus assembly PilX family protein [Gracilibacillus kekensis]|uniref:PilX N-terminal n=1 Tax=Gracilibacillus kekensis TaxID=1027249 RepID=A0A1M7NXL9_9BACI|nr:pilus assembly PilX N-terminal domain-containing protein [Gracilibacillus kekensis]SHN08384.1 PilX N-terminal [Gracilibacillus kekensis]